MFVLQTKRVWRNPAKIADPPVKLHSTAMKHDSAPLEVFIGREGARGVLNDEPDSWFCVVRQELSPFLRLTCLINVIHFRTWLIFGCFPRTTRCVITNHNIHTPCATGW